MSRVTDPDKYLSQYGDSLYVELVYPRNEQEPIKSVQVGLMDARAADNIRVSYDFERDGWKIEQAAIFSWDFNDDVCDQDWREVAFVQAWGRQKIQGHG